MKIQIWKNKTTFPRRNLMARGLHLWFIFLTCYNVLVYVSARVFAIVPLGFPSLAFIITRDVEIMRYVKDCLCFEWARIGNQILCLLAVCTASAQPCIAKFQMFWTFASFLCTEDEENMMRNLYMYCIRRARLWLAALISSSGSSQWGSWLVCVKQAVQI